MPPTVLNVRANSLKRVGVTAAREGFREEGVVGVVGLKGYVTSSLPRQHVTAHQRISTILFGFPLQAITPLSDMQKARQQAEAFVLRGRGRSKTAKKNSAI